MNFRMWRSARFCIQDLRHRNGTGQAPERDGRGCSRLIDAMAAGTPGSRTAPADGWRGDDTRAQWFERDCTGSVSEMDADGGVSHSTIIHMSGRRPAEPLAGGPLRDFSSELAWRWRPSRPPPPARAASGWISRPVEKPADGRLELFGQARLRQHSRRAGFERAALDRPERVPREEDDRNPPRARVLRQAASGRDAIEPRHREIHDDGVRTHRDGESNGVLAITRRDRAEAPRLEELGVE